MGPTKWWWWLEGLQAAKQRCWHAESHCFARRGKGKKPGSQNLQGAVALMVWWWQQASKLRNLFGTPTRTYLGPAPLQKCVGDFCCINFGGFCRGFSWRIISGHFFPQKMRRKHQATESAKTSGGSKLKIREKSVLPSTGPNKPSDTNLLRK